MVDGSRLSRWTCTIPFNGDISIKALSFEAKASTKSQENALSRASSYSEPPLKKRRLSGSIDDGILPDEQQEDQISKQPISPIKPLTFIALASTKEGKHVIAVTGEDKCIRVLEHDGTGQLCQLSQRTMPKRPCAIAITDDDSTIICADKFGDVYSLPLAIPVCSGNLDQPEDSPNPSLFPQSPPKPFIPAANSLTVHSVRNRRALESQMRQKRTAMERPAPKFELKLLLGHISMLTDIALVERQGRSYIITADRDEHIRISRGIPQAHVIERYCLGHREFVSRLCFPSPRPNILVSGGGDDEIYVWDWYLGEVIHKFNLRLLIEKVMSKNSHLINGAINSEANEEGTSSEPTKIAVSKISHMPKESCLNEDYILVICEGIPALFVLSLLGDSSMSHYNTLLLEGNPLDVIVDNTLKSAIISIDCAHMPGSTSHRRTCQLGETLLPLQIFKMKDSGLVKNDIRFDVAYNKTAAISDDAEADIHSLSHLLYSLENLRKRGGEE